MPCWMPPSICPAAAIGWMTLPISCTGTTCATVICPVSVSTSTSTKCAANEYDLVGWYVALPTNCAAGTPLRGATASRMLSARSLPRTRIRPSADSSSPAGASSSPAARSNSCRFTSAAAICAALPPR